MKLIGLAMAVVHGFLAVGVLALIQAIVQAFAPAWHLPFSIWWGLLFCAPGIAFAFFAASRERSFNDYRARNRRF